jgi:hypothetical protein
MLNRLKRKTGCVRRRHSSQSWAIAVEELEDRLLLSSTPAPMALTPAEVRSYYGFDKIQFTYYTVFQSRFGPIFTRATAPGDGTGQTIAIIDKYYDPNIQNDVNVFDSQFNLPAINLIVDKLPSAKTTAPPVTGRTKNRSTSNGHTPLRRRRASSSSIAARRQRTSSTPSMSRRITRAANATPEPAGLTLAGTGLLAFVAGDERLLSESRCVA